MTIHLNTNLLVEVGLSGSAMRASLTAWLMEGNHLAASTIAWSEFCNGPLSTLNLKDFERFVPLGLRLHTF